MLRPMESWDDLAELMLDSRVSSCLFGPGAGLGRNAREGVETILGSDAYRSGRCAVVLDADALTEFAHDAGRLFALLRRGRSVLTPHRGEFARLFPDLDRQLRAKECSAVEAVRQAAWTAEACVLLKGGCTMIADCEGICLNPSTGRDAAPWLATAGSGDVLAGIVAGLLGRGFLTMDAASAGAWLHAEAARGFGPGLTADDLPGRMPNALRGAIALQGESEPEGMPPREIFNDGEPTAARPETAG